MCYYYSIGDLIELAKWYGIKAVQLPLFETNEIVSGFTHPLMPIISNIDPNDISFMRWGLIPSWAKEDVVNDFWKNTLNARGDTVFEKPSFRVPIISKRCIVPAASFMEWHHKETEKIPYVIEPVNAPFFSFGGIYDIWKNPKSGEVLETFSIITTDANPLMAEIHNSKKRMPLILDKEDMFEWLNSSLSKNSIQNLIKPYSENKMKASIYKKKKTDE